MKKAILLLAMLCITLMVNAQNITGFWYSNLSDDGMDGYIVMELNADGSAEVGTIALGTQDLGDGLSMKIRLSARVSGKWTRANGKIHIACYSDATCDFEIDIPGLDDATLSEVRKRIASEMAGAREEMIRSINNQTSTMTITEKAGKTVLIEDDTKDVYYRR